MFRAASTCAAKYCRNSQGSSSVPLARILAYYPVHQYRRQYRWIDLQPINASPHRSKAFRGLLTNLEPKSGDSRVELYQFTIQCIRWHVYRDTSSLKVVACHESQSRMRLVSDAYCIHLCIT